MSWSCRKAACVDPRDQVARQLTAPWRRSDQNSRWMFGRWVAEAIGPGIVLPGSNIVRSGEKRMEDRRRHARKVFGHAGRHTRALVAIDRYGRLRRTARHVVCHLVHRIRRWTSHPPLPALKRAQTPPPSQAGKPEPAQDRRSSGSRAAGVWPSSASQDQALTNLKRWKALQLIYHASSMWPALIGIKLPNAR